MATTHDDATRRIDFWFDSYSRDHRNPRNVRIHLVAVPSILWSIIALAWCIPVPAGGWFRPGIFAALGMVPTFLFYWRASRVLGIAMLSVLVAMGASCWWIQDAFGLRALLILGVVVFVVAWIAQFVGHKWEGCKPTFLKDLTYLLIGPAWVVAKLLRKLGIAW